MRPVPAGIRPYRLNYSLRINKGVVESCLFFPRKEVERLIELDKLPAIIEEAFYAYAIGEASMPPKIYLDIPQQ